MQSGQIFVKTLIPARSYPNYISFELYNLRLQPNLFRYVHTFKKQSSNETKMKEFATKIQELFKYNQVLRILRQSINQVPKKLKNESVKCVKTWTRQCECVSAQQLRRGQQMLTLYTKLWGERALNEFFRHIRQTLLRHGKQFIIGAVGICAFDWNENRIPDEEIMSHYKDFDYINMLKDNETNCQCCKKLKPVKNTELNDQYCKCPLNKEGKNYKDNWEPYVQRPDLFVWRRHRPNGCYEYKVYGKYDDVTAIDFLKVQIDIDYRKKWDTNAIALDIIEKEPTTNSDIIYWEMLWPRLFVNRDYVFSRRYIIQEEENMLYLYNKGIEHPCVPAKKDKYRITDYYSCMVIRPTSKMDKPGIEFSLTYFDNPGVNIPAAVTSWVAMAAMPDFLAKLRIAAKEYKDYCVKLEKGIKDRSQCDTEIITPPPNTISNEVLTDGDSKSSYWRYLHPHYYFG